MNYYDACNILGLSNGFCEKELKHNYYVQALQYHPDKNKDKDIDAKKKFQEILDAYNYLDKYNKYNNSDEFDDIDDIDECDKNSYLNILEKFLNGSLNQTIDAKQFISILNNKCSEITIELLNYFSKNTLLKLQKFINQYSDILHIKTDIINKVDNLIKDYIKNDIIEVINPSFENLINNEIYKLNYNDEIYYIPTWHHELIYDLSDNSLIIQCEPELPEYITLDQYNNLYVNLSTSIISILNDDSITINILDNKYIIPTNELLIKKYQRYELKDNGLALIDTKDIYNVNNKAKIYVDIYFTDIK